jgi:type VI secretion system protein VasD
MQTKRFRFARLAIPLTAIAAFTAGCGHDPPPPAAAPPPQQPSPCTEPEMLGIRLSASGHLNPGERGEPLTTVVRVYQLKRPEKLTSASFDDMLDRDKDMLGADLVEVQEMTLNPGETIPRALKRAPDAAFIAAVALFRKPTGTAWRAVKQIPATDPNRCHTRDGKQKDKVEIMETARFYFDGNRVEIR